MLPVFYIHSQMFVSALSFNFSFIWTQFQFYVNFLYDWNDIHEKLIEMLSTQKTLKILCILWHCKNLPKRFWFFWNKNCVSSHFLGKILAPVLIVNGQRIYRSKLYKYNIHEWIEMQWTNERTKNFVCVRPTDFHSLEFTMYAH